MNRAVFFASVRESVFHGKLTQQQVDGMTRILDYYEEHYASTMSRKQFAYLLATITHETAFTMQPIKEIGGSRMRYAPAYGRGLVQITHDANYKKFGAIPYDKALEWPTALDIAFRGCADGMFTGKSLGDYINARKTDYVGARRCVNGSDRASLIAGYARSFDAALAKAAAAPVISDEPVSDAAPSILDDVLDTIDWTRPHAQRPPVIQKDALHGEKTKIASAVIAALGALSVLDWNAIIQSPRTGYAMIISALIVSVGHVYLPQWLWWALPKEKTA